MKIEGLVFCGSSCTVIPTKHSIVYFLPRSTFSLFHDLFNGRSYFAFIFRKFFFLIYCITFIKVILYREVIIIVSFTNLTFDP